MHCVAVRCIVWRYNYPSDAVCYASIFAVCRVLVGCSELQWVAVCGSVLQCVAVCLQLFAAAVRCVFMFDVCVFSKYTHIYLYV